MSKAKKNNYVLSMSGKKDGASANLLVTISSDEPLSQLEVKFQILQFLEGAIDHSGFDRSINMNPKDFDLLIAFAESNYQSGYTID